MPDQVVDILLRARGDAEDVNRVIDGIIVRSKEAQEEFSDITKQKHEEWMAKNWTPEQQAKSREDYAHQQADTHRRVLEQERRGKGTEADDLDKYMKGLRERVDSEKTSAQIQKEIVFNKKYLVELEREHSRILEGDQSDKKLLRRKELITDEMRMVRDDIPRAEKEMAERAQAESEGVFYGGKSWFARSSALNFMQGGVGSIPRTTLGYLASSLAEAPLGMLAAGAGIGYLGYKELEWLKSSYSSWDTLQKTKLDLIMQGNVNHPGGEDQDLNRKLRGWSSDLALPQGDIQKFLSAFRGTFPANKGMTDYNGLDLLATARFNDISPQRALDVGRMAMRMGFKTDPASVLLELRRSALENGMYDQNSINEYINATMPLEQTLAGRLGTSMGLGTFKAAEGMTNALGTLGYKGAEAAAIAGQIDQAMSNPGNKLAFMAASMILKRQGKAGTYPQIMHLLRKWETEAPELPSVIRQIEMGAGYGAEFVRESFMSMGIQNEEVAAGMAAGTWSPVGTIHKGFGGEEIGRIKDITTTTEFTTTRAGFDIEAIQQQSMEAIMGSPIANLRQWLLAGEMVLHDFVDGAHKYDAATVRRVAAGSGFFPNKGKLPKKKLP